MGKRNTEAGTRLGEALRQIAEREAVALRTALAKHPAPWTYIDTGEIVDDNIVFVMECSEDIGEFVAGCINAFAENAAEAA